MGRGILLHYTKVFYCVDFCCYVILVLLVFVAFNLAAYVPGKNCFNDSVLQVTVVYLEIGQRLCV